MKSRSITPREWFEFLVVHPSLHRVPISSVIVKTRTQITKQKIKGRIVKYSLNIKTVWVCRKPYVNVSSSIIN